MKIATFIINKLPSLSRSSGPVTKIAGDLLCPCCVPIPHGIEALFIVCSVCTQVGE
jgi:hypothetical protein